MSKLEAENYLWNISENTNLEVVVIRLPLVYGYGVKGNMRHYEIDQFRNPATFR